MLGAQSVKFMNQPDNRLESLDLIERIEVEISTMNQKWFMYTMQGMSIFLGVFMKL